MVNVVNHLVQRYKLTDDGLVVEERPDQLAIEEALQLYLIYHDSSGALHKMHFATLMRTPNNDSDLIYGLLFNEGIIETSSDVSKISSLAHNHNLWKVQLAPTCKFDPEEHKRNLLASSSCGVCASVKDNLNSELALDNVDITPSLLPTTLSMTTIFAIYHDLNQRQQLFQRTGGVHGVALYDWHGQCIIASEDVGRHNACDKVIGFALCHNLLVDNQYCLVFSGRISYELIQKAHRAQIKLILALGAPSSLAVELASRYQITLIAFIKPSKQLNVYAGNIIISA